MANFDDLFTAPTATETQSDRPQLTKEEYAAKKKAERDSLYALADEMAQEGGHAGRRSLSGLFGCAGTI